MSEEAAAPEAVVEESAPIQEETVTEEVSEEISEPVSEEVPEVKAETEAELEEEIQEAAEAGASEEEIKDMIRQFTLKVDGKEITKEIDLSDEEALKREFQMAAKGQKSMQELAELKKQYEAGLKRIMENPFAALQELDPEFDPLQISSDFIRKKYEEQQMSPEEREKVAQQKEYEELKAEMAKIKQEKEDADKQAVRQQMADEIQTDIMSALEGDDELIVDQETVGLVVKELIIANQKGYDLTAAQVLPTVKDQLRDQFERASNRFKNTDTLKKYMGKGLLDKLKEERLEQAKKQVKSVSSINKDVAKPAKKKEDDAPKRKLSDLMR